MAVEKRVRFKSWWLPWALVAPQMVIVLVFFFWPAGQALYQSVLQEDAFGASTEFVGMQNFVRLWDDETYLASFKTTDKSRGVRLGNMLQVRAIVDEELEQVWAGKKGAQEALDAIVKRGNEQLERFEKANKG